MKIKVRINHNGVILISSAQMVEKKELSETEQNGNENEAQQSQSSESSSQGDNAAGAPQSPKEGPEPMDVQQEVSLLDDFHIRILGRFWKIFFLLLRILLVK